MTMKMRTFVIFLGLFFITAAPIKADIPMPGQIESYNSAHCGPGETLVLCETTIQGKDTCKQYRENKKYYHLDSVGTSYSSSKYCAQASFSSPLEALSAFSIHAWLFYKVHVAVGVCIVIIISLFLYRRKKSH